MEMNEVEINKVEMNSRMRSPHAQVVEVLNQHFGGGKVAQDGGGNEWNYNRKRGGAMAKRTAIKTKMTLRLSKV